MKRKTVPVDEAAKDWFKSPAFRRAYEALEEEFVLAAALIGARSAAQMTQAQVAQAMGTTQAVVGAPRKRARHAINPHAAALRKSHKVSAAHRL